MVFHWSQTTLGVFWIFKPNVIILWSGWSLFFLWFPIFPVFSKPLGTIPSVPITIVTNVTYMFHIFLALRQYHSICLSFRFLSFSFFDQLERQNPLAGKFFFLVNYYHLVNCSGLLAWIIIIIIYYLNENLKSGSFIIRVHHKQTEQCVE